MAAGTGDADVPGTPEAEDDTGALAAASAGVGAGGGAAHEASSPAQAAIAKML